jgi:hypothetical protein
MAKKKNKNKKTELKCNAQVSIVTNLNKEKAEEQFLHLLHKLDEFCMNNGIDIWVDKAYIDKQEI